MSVGVVNADIGPNGHQIHEYRTLTWRYPLKSAYIGAVMSSPSPAAGGSFWFTTGDPGPGRAPAAGRHRVDVAVVGGGFTGLWAAIGLLDADPSLRVAVLEAERVGWGASGRNGGFCAASLTHGLSNGLLHFPEETGTLDVATEPHQVDDLRASVELANRHGNPLRFLERDEIQAEIPSPRFLAGVRAGGDRTVMVNPAKLAWALAAAVERRGGAIFEGSRVTGLRRRANGVDVLVAGGGVVEASQVLVGTSAYSGWLRRLVPAFVPVYDYVLMTEPMTPGQRASIGWLGREGLSDAGHQFHYFRLTADDRMLWGGYDAIYHPGNRVLPAHDRRPRPHSRCSTGSGSRTAGAERSTPRRGST